MMDFKNSLVIQGSEVLLEAFAKEIRNIGYRDSFGANFKDKNTLATYVTGEYNTFRNPGKVGNSGLKEAYYPELKLPQDWDKALKLAAEKEVEEPKFKVGDYCSLYTEYKGECDNFGIITAVSDREYTINHEIGGHNREVCIEEFDAIYHKISDEKALEILKEHYAKKGFIVGNKATWGFKNQWHEIREFQLTKSVELYQGTVNGNSLVGKSALAINLNGSWYTVDTYNIEVREKQEIVQIGHWEVKLVKKGDIPFIQIGCADSQNYYSKGALEAILGMLKGTSMEGITINTPNGHVSFTQKQVESLLKMINE